MNTVAHFLATAGTDISLLLLALRWMRNGGIVAKIGAMAIFAATGVTVVSAISPSIGFAIIGAIAAVIAIPVFLVCVLPVAGSMLAASAVSARGEASAAERERVAYVNSEIPAAR